MLKKFKVKNFKNFSEELEIDFSNINSKYDFNCELMKNEVINKAAIYGENASGKSNLGLAIFDIVKNLTDKETRDDDYKNYLFANSKEDYAEFYYEFKIGSSIVEYAYKKKDYETIIDEEFKINGKIILKYDKREKDEPIFNLPEASTLNKKIKDNKISIVRYVIKNTVLSSNTIIMRFFNFVDKMLFFKSVEGNKYIGYEKGSSSINEKIIKENRISQLEEFLNNAGIKCKLSIILEGIGNEKIAFEFGEKKIAFYDIASSGTKDLVLLFYWLTEFEKVSFAYIDEFDAHYHFKLSKLMMEELKKKSNTQVVVSTHTTALMNNRILRPDCYFKLENNKIKSISELAGRDLEKAHDIEKIYRSGGF